MNVLGLHTLFELYECDLDTLSQIDAVRALMLSAAVKSNATVVNEVFHQFNPHGVSGVVVLAESHLAIHTWPEHGYAAIDLFTCSHTVDVPVLESLLKAGFQSRRVERVDLERGKNIGGSFLKPNRELSAND